MIMPQTRLLVADNTGARIVQCIGVPGGSNRVASIGRIITVSIKSARPDAKVEPGQIHRALVIRTRKEVGRGDGRYIRFDDNAVVLLQPDGKPLGTRVLGPVPQELRRGNWLKLLNVTSRIV